MLRTYFTDLVSLMFSAPICVAAGQHFTQRKVVMLGGLIGALGLSLSGLLFSIEWVILTFGALYGKLIVM